MPSLAPMVVANLSPQTSSTLILSDVAFTLQVIAQASRRCSICATAYEPGTCQASARTHPKRGFVMMMEGCGMGMMVMMWVAGLLGLALLASLIVLSWVVIGRLRRDAS